MDQPNKRQFLLSKGNRRYAHLVPSSEKVMHCGPMNLSWWSMMLYDARI